MNCRNLSGARIGCVMTGSFCTFRAAFDAWRALKNTGAELYPIMSFNASAIDTRFCSAAEAVSTFGEICGREVWNSLAQVEPIGPKKLLDMLIIAPCTGNTLAKLACGIADTPATLAFKSHMRNGRPALIAVSTNDGLGQNAKNIGALLPLREVYFVPFRQDDSTEKPNSLVADFSLVTETASNAIEKRRIQPILRQKPI